jgi:hypothetical protein
MLLSWGAVRNGVHLDYGVPEFIRGELSRFFLYGVAAEIAVAIFGIPAFVLFRKFHITSWLWYSLGGAVISQLVNICLAMTGTLYFLTGQPSKLQACKDAVIPFFLCGVLSALLFRVFDSPAPV